MKKQKLEIEIEVRYRGDGKKDGGYEYLSSNTSFYVYSTRGTLLRSLEAIERKLKNKYPIEKELPIPNETKLFGHSSGGSNDDVVGDESPVNQK